MCGLRFANISPDRIGYQCLAGGAPMTQRESSLPGNLGIDHYRLLVEQVKDHAIFMITPQGNIATWNTGAERINGYRPEEIIGKDFSVLYEPEEVEGGKPQRGLHLAQAYGSFEDFGWRVRKDGTRYWANEIITPLYTSTELIGYSMIIRDLNERRAVEESFLESREEFRTLADSLPNIVWTADERGHITYWNRSFYKFTGIREHEVHRAKLVSYVHPEDLEKLRSLWRESISTGREFEAQYRLKSKTGDYYWHLARALPLRGSKGKVLKWIGAAFDVHEQRMMMERKDEFIGIAGHELRTPLTSVKAYIQLLERSLDTQDCDSAMKYLRKTHTFIERLNTLVADLLDISKLQRGKLPLQFSVFSIDDFVKDFAEVMRMSYPGYTITVEGRSGKYVRADRARLEQVITNYVSNAVKYSPGSNKIEIRTEYRNQHVHVIVKDYGMGIPEDQLKNVFNKFFRAKNLKTSIQGLGLGLYIAWEIIKLHGGTVGVRSKVGEGSEFYFKLPVYAEADKGAGSRQ
jgi:PAS domain S-box-containing protein